MTNDYERLGAFYLGKAIDEEADQPSDEKILYDSGDLTTHAVIIGMTGSGKTGLGIGLLEEAALDKIPVIAIDPKGDLGNILLTFPKLRGEDFRPWIDPRTARSKGSSADEYAESQAALWRKGLKQWGQSKERIAKLRETVDMAIYTPGSSAGLPVSVLQSFNCPADELKNDKDLYRERISSTATGILTLVNLAGDPLTSREHILISAILGNAWDAGKDMALAELIQAIQEPPVDKVGVMSMAQFFPKKERFKLAMQLNNLLAAPGFESWMQGQPLEAERLFYSDNGKPRVSVVSIAHLNDSERMFFVTMLLAEISSWMRRQPGTGSLRAILYMDEIFGYLPPTANPPSKVLFLTLLKQARAYGLGLVLATQNPVDLDYKALSNAGTWFIGRLQTERDKSRVMEGLEGAGAGAKFDKQGMERLLAGLGSRKFLLHNVHENEPVVFSTRWVMSYLSGPFTREQIKRLMGPHKTDAKETEAEDENPKPGPEVKPVESKPALPVEVQQLYMTVPKQNEADPRFQPILFGLASLHYSNARYHVEASREIAAGVEIGDEPAPVVWDRADLLEIETSQLASKAPKDARYADIAPAGVKSSNYKKWERTFKSWLRNQQSLHLFRCPELKAVSEPFQSEGEFRARLQIAAREARDKTAARLRSKYDQKIERLEKQLIKADQRLKKEQADSATSTVDSVISVGSAILGAFTGRKRVSATSIRQIGGAFRKAGRIRKEQADIAIAEAALLELKDEFVSLNEEFERELKLIDENFDAQKLELTPLTVKPKSTDIHIRFFGILWRPLPDPD